MTNVNSKLITNYLLIILYSYIFVYLLPWEDIKIFSDIENYLSRILYLSRGGEERTFSGLSILSGEGLWKFILLNIAHSGYDYKEFLYFISFISLSIYAFFTIKRVNIILILVFFLNPMFIDLIMGQIRIALAFSLLLIAYEMKSKKIALALLFSAIFIHTAALLIIGIYFILFRMSLLFRTRKYFLYSIIFALIVSLFLKYGIDILLVGLDDKRVNYSSVIKASSISYSLFWFLITLILVLKAKFGNEKNNIIIAFSIVMMSIFFFSSLIGSYGQRYVAISIPLIVISINYLPKYYREGTFILFGIYQLLQLIYWTKYQII